MSRQFQWLGLASRREFLRFLPGVLEEESCPTLLFNESKWKGRRELADAIRRTRALVADNDGTIIHGSQWMDLRERMSLEQRDGDAEDAAAYYRGERTDAGDVAFLESSVRRLVASGLTRAHVHVDARKQFPRSGVGDLFRSYGQGAHTAIVSFGLHGYIDAWALAHDIPVGEIHAARLRWSGPGEHDALAGIEDPESIVVEATKGRARERFSERVKMDGRDVLIVEDTPRMLARMRHPDNVCVLIVPRHDPQEKRRVERMRQMEDDAFFSIVDVILVADSLEPLAQLRK